MSRFFADNPSSKPRKQNREVFIGPTPAFSWTVPSGTTEVEVHVWGGGGNGNGGGGGGGGYARAIYSVTSADTLSITVGGSGGTSSVTIPTQSPISPISATGGTTSPSGTTSPGGTGGSGSVSLSPLHSTSYCKIATGGTGGTGGYAPGTFCSACGGGGASAGSPFGDGKNGGCSITCGGGSGGASALVDGVGGVGGSGGKGGLGGENTPWFYMDEMVVGDGGIGGHASPTPVAGVGEIISKATGGGFLAGGGGGGGIAPTVTVQGTIRSAPGGIAGGGGGGGYPGFGPGCGGNGAVIIYY